ncbi:putative Ganglioside-induced differentiation-associated protein 1 [Hypsibius exemplaris]|uniref:Ganglioside-induced differentiation-associated protein 1 n=1 Tax=Hypsibius exemplaris TaxID=2072580 RepID=A0A1W0WPW6_HYPEX|nr:putative Ganglioside-induced differentiation-associated protein 1 [Hypsibius exemplaris]
MADAVKNGLPEDSSKVVIYQYYSSYWSQMVRLACVEKGIPFTKVEIDLVKGENYNPDYLRINPACEVPALAHNGKIIDGSQPIIDYLDQISVHDKPQGQRQEEIEAFRRECCQLPMAEITVGVVLNPTLLEGAKVPEKTMENFSKRVNRRAVLEENIVKYPELADAYRAKLERVIATEVQVANVATIYDLLKNLERYLDNVDGLLRINAAENRGKDSYEWLFGKDFTNADIALAILLARLDLLGLAGRLWDVTDRIYLADYYRRLKERPSFRQECVPYISEDHA